MPNRNYVWLMARDYQLSEDEYQSLVDRAGALGYDITEIVRIPHRWPETDTGTEIEESP